MKKFIDTISEDKKLNFILNIENYGKYNYNLTFQRINNEENSFLLNISVGESYEVFTIKTKDPLYITEEEINRIIKHADLVYESYGCHGPGKYGIEIHVDDETIDKKEVIEKKYLSNVVNDMSLSNISDAITYMSDFFNISKDEFIKNLEEVGENYNGEMMYIFKINKEKTEEYDEKAREAFRKSNKMII